MSEPLTYLFHFKFSVLRRHLEIVSKASLSKRLLDSVTCFTRFLDIKLFCDIGARSFCHWYELWSIVILSQSFAIRYLKEFPFIIKLRFSCSLFLLGNRRLGHFFYDPQLKLTIAIMRTFARLIIALLVALVAVFDIGALQLDELVGLPHPWNERFILLHGPGKVRLQALMKLAWVRLRRILFKQDSLSVRHPFKIFSTVLFIFCSEVESIFSKLLFKLLLLQIELYLGIVQAAIAADYTHTLFVK